MSRTSHIVLSIKKGVRSKQYKPLLSVKAWKLNRKIKSMHRWIKRKGKANAELNEHHRSLLLNYMRFARFQRGQSLKTVSGFFDDAKQTKFPDSTYTVDEVLEALDDLCRETVDEVESELINSTHTNVLMLQQAQKWHLDLDADLAELENRELLDKVKLWEESELSDLSASEKPSLSPKKRLAPLNASGPVPLLQKQIQDLQEENDNLKSRLRSVETTATSALSAKAEYQQEMERMKSVQSETATPTQIQQSSEIDELAAAVESMRSQMDSENELNKKNQAELETDLTSTKHKLLEIQHQLKLAEKELEKKFSETGAYKNMKKMLASKNDIIKELRTKLKSAGVDSE